MLASCLFFRQISFSGLIVAYKQCLTDGESSVKGCAIWGFWVTAVFWQNTSCYNFFEKKYFRFFSISGEVLPLAQIGVCIWRAQMGAMLQKLNILSDKKRYVTIFWQKTLWHKFSDKKLMLHTALIADFFSNIIIICNLIGRFKMPSCIHPGEGTHRPVAVMSVRNRR